MSNQKNMTEAAPILWGACPSCGSTEIVTQAQSTGHRDGYACVCTACLSQGPLVPTSELAREKWNELAGLKDAVERVALAPELFARYAMGPEAVAMLKHAVPLASHPILAPMVDASLYRKALAGLDHCASIATKALGR